MKTRGLKYNLNEKYLERKAWYEEDDDKPLTEEDKPLTEEDKELLQFEKKLEDILSVEKEKKKKIKSKLSEIIQNKNLLTFKQFLNLLIKKGLIDKNNIKLKNKNFDDLKDIKILNKSIIEHYIDHLQNFIYLHYKLITTKPYNYKNDENAYYTGFKTAFKNSKLIKDNNLKIPSIKEEKIPKKLLSNYFPKDNKKYQLHHVATPGTYQIDLFFTGKYCYLNAIEVNTRYLFSCPTNLTPKDINIETYYKNNKTISDKINIITKSALAIYNAMDTLFTFENWNPKIIRCDGEKGFFSKMILQLLKYKNVIIEQVPRIKFEEIKQSTPLHSSLALIDRVARTLRDMAYNLNYNEIDPKLMKKLVLNYNLAPHKTLSKLLKSKISPYDAHNNPEIENEIINKLNQLNLEIKSQKDYYIPIKQKVAIYNDKHPLIKRRTIVKPYIYEIIDNSKSLFVLKNLTTNETIFVPRFKIKI